MSAYIQPLALERSSQPSARAGESVQCSEGAFFDRLAAGGAGFNPFKQRGWRTLEQRFRSMVPLRKPAKLLDVGCGTGQSRQIYRAHVTEFVGIDLSRLSLKIAAKNFPEDRWEVGDACGLPFGDQTFDVVAFSSVLHHIPDFERALREAYRVLRVGGFAFAFDPNLLHPAMALFRCPWSPFYVAQGVSPNERPLLPSELRGAFKRAGFDNIKQRCQSDIPYRKLAARFLDCARFAYNLGDRLWESLGLGRWFGTFVATCGSKSDGHC